MTVGQSERWMGRSEREMTAAHAVRVYEWRYLALLARGVPERVASREARNAVQRWAAERGYDSL